VEGNDLHGGDGYVCVGETARVGVNHAMVEVKLLRFRWLPPILKLVQRGFQDLLKVKPSLLMCGRISSSIASLMSQSMYPVSAERSFVPYSLMMWSRLMLCSTTADLSVCASLICLLCSLIRNWIDRPLCPI